MLESFYILFFGWFGVQAITPGSRAGLEPRSGGKTVAVQPIVIGFTVNLQ